MPSSSDWINPALKLLSENLLPIGLTFGERLKRNIGMNQPIRISEVEINPSIVFILCNLQDEWLDGKLNDGKLYVNITMVEEKLLKYRFLIKI